MKEWFIASSLAMAGGGAYYSGALDSADIVRTVAKPPSEVYDGFGVVLNDYSPDLFSLAQLSADAEANKALNEIEFDVKTVEDKSIDYTLILADRPVINIKVNFEPIEGGAKTKVEADVELHELPQMEGAPPMMMPGGETGFNIMVGAMVDMLIKNIENGTVSQWSDQLAMLRGQMLSDPRFADMRLAADQARRESAMADASAPMVDPSEEALRPVGVSAAPSVDVSR